MVSEAERVAEARAPGPRHAHRAPGADTLDPPELEETRRDRCTERPGEMEPPLTPVEAGSRERPPVASQRLDVEAERRQCLLAALSLDSPSRLCGGDGLITKRIP
jgi:hypothetical protein